MSIHAYTFDVSHTYTYIVRFSNLVLGFNHESTEILGSMCTYTLINIG